MLIVDSDCQVSLYSEKFCGFRFLLEAVAAKEGITDSEPSLS